jgi:hypothetical protein
MMKRFSLKTCVAVALLHVVGSIWLIAAAVSRMKAYEHGETFVWLTVLSWIWMPVPVSLGHHFGFGPARYLYYLALPWSVFVGVCFGFIRPRLGSWRHRII